MQYRYRTMTYYPNINSDEFVNVGVNIDDKYKIISNKQLAKKYCGDINIATGLLKTLKDELNSTGNLNNWYGNYIRASEIRIIRDNRDIDITLDQLFKDYVWSN